jgi:hypothetical protein
LNIEREEYNVRRLVGIVCKYKNELSVVGVMTLYCVIAYALSLPCPINYVSGISCPGCGMTRAVISLCKLDLARAFYYHPMVFFIIPAVPCYLVLKSKGKVGACRALAVVFALLMIGVYLFRILNPEASPLDFDAGDGLFFRLINKVT